MALPKQISMLNVFILLITCNVDSTMQNSNFSLDHASIGRLVKALSYDLTLNLFLEDFPVFHGASTNFIVIKNPTREIDLNIYGLTIKTYTIRLFRYPYKDYYSCKKYYYPNETRLILYFDSEIPTGLYNMTVEFSRAMFENEFNRTCYKDCNGKARWIIRMEIGQNGILPKFSDWDELSSIARFGVTIKHYRNNTAFSNLPIQSQWNVNYDVMQTQFDSTAVSAHRIAFSLTDFKCFIKKTRFLTTRVCPTSLVKEQITFVLNISAAVISYLTSHTKISPQFADITLIGLPNSSYEVAKNWGSNYYREDRLVYNESLDLIDHKLIVWTHTAHISAFQWFNNLFSPIWTHVWLHQTLALFYGAKAFAKTYGDEDISSLFIYGLRSLARENDTVQQVKHDNNPEDFIKRYSFQTILKAYAVMVMLEDAVSEFAFHKVVISYLKKPQFSTATLNSFWDSIEEGTILSTIPNVPPTSQLMQNWLMLRSLPVIKVTDDYLQIMSEDVYEEEYYNNNTDDLRMLINYRVCEAGSVKPFSFMGQFSKEKVLVLPNSDIDWAVINWQYAGYYRVKYDSTFLKKLVTSLAFKTCGNIDVLNRAQIIEDAYYLWTINELDTDMFKNLTYFMETEEQCAPWYAIQKIAQKLSTLSNVSDHDKRRIKDHTLALLDRLIQKVGYTEHPDDMECVKFKRLLATKWLCRFNYFKCLENAEKILVERLKNPERHELSPIWEEWTYCNGLKTSDEFTWNKVLIEFHVTRNKKIFTYLTCSHKLSIILKYLDLVTSKNKLSILDLYGVNVEDRQKIYQSIVEKYVWQDAVLDHLINKLEKMEITDVPFSEMLTPITENIHSQHQRNKLLSLLAKIHNYDGDDQNRFVYRDMVKLISRGNPNSYTQ